MRAVRFAMGLPAPMLVLLALMPVLSAAGPEPIPFPADPAAAGGMQPAPAAVAPTPMVAELLAAVDEQERLLAEIRIEVGLTRSASRRLELHRRIETIKRDTELQLLQIQVAYARREGRVEVVELLEAAIAQVTAPPERREPEMRPSPTAASN